MLLQSFHCQWNNLQDERNSTSKTNRVSMLGDRPEDWAKILTKYNRWADS